MNLHQEFHEHLQAGRISAAISLVVSQLVELKITTKASAGKLHTTVDLLSGQITSTVDPAFFSDKASQKLLEFHTNQITATTQVVREQLRSLQDLLQVLAPAPSNGVPEKNVVAEKNTVADSNTSDILPLDQVISSPPAEIIAISPVSETLPVELPIALPIVNPVSIPEKATVNPIAPEQPNSVVAKTPEHPQKNTNQQLEPVIAVKEPEAPLLSKPEPVVAKSPIKEAKIEEIKTPEVAEPTKTETNNPPTPQPVARTAIASNLAAALAQTTALDPSEAATIPNKFDQALKSAGVRATEEEIHPFTPAPNTALRSTGTTTLPNANRERELMSLLNESDEDWDEWLLEEDHILSELSDVTKDKLPDIEANWLAKASSGITGDPNFSVEEHTTRPPAEWDEFMPECADLNTVTNKNQANVERFRQNLVNDPQLMSELLAELDDLEELGEGKPKL
jgi:hypothetical protein